MTVVPLFPEQKPLVESPRWKLRWAVETGAWITLTDAEAATLLAELDERGDHGQSATGGDPPP